MNEDEKRETLRRAITEYSGFRARYRELRKGALSRRQAVVLADELECDLPLGQFTPKRWDKPAKRP